MNKLLTVLFLSVFLTATLKSQETIGGPQSQYGILQGKLKKSEAGLTNEKKNTNAKFWYSRAELMLEIWNIHMQFVQQGARKMDLALLMGKADNIESYTKDGVAYEKHIYERITIVYKGDVVDSWEETNKFYEDPLPEALRSLQKAEELDVDKKLDKKLTEKYEVLKGYLDRDGILYFTQGNYDLALRNFSLLLEANNSRTMEGVIDTVVYYNAGMAASKAGKTDESIKYYELAAKYEHKEANLYVFLKNKYMEKGDTATAIEKLKTGFEKYPDSQGILVELINYYLLNEKAEDALAYLKIAREGDPENVNFIFAEGTLYDKIGDTEKAIAAYEKAIELKPDFFNGYFNLGVFYYNNAVKIYESCDEIPINDVDAYDKCKADADETLSKAIPYMEKAHEISPNDKQALETLKTLYLRLKSRRPELEEKYNKVMEELNAM